VRNSGIPLRDGRSYPRTYYPGTTERTTAMPIIVEHGRANDGLDYSVPRILPTLLFIGHDYAVGGLTLEQGAVAGVHRWRQSAAVGVERPRALLPCAKRLLIARV
jgi:hypothetical protein